jgi:hypothetical protein
MPGRMYPPWSAFEYGAFVNVVPLYCPRTGIIFAERNVAECKERRKEGGKWRRKIGAVAAISLHLGHLLAITSILSFLSTTNLFEMMRRGGGPRRGGKSGARSGPAKGKFGSNPKKANDRTASKRANVADKPEKKKPLSQHDVYEDSSDGEGNAAFYSHIDEEARPDVEGMDDDIRRRFRATMIGENDEPEDDDFEDEEIDEDEAFDEEDEQKYGELLSGIGQSKGKDLGKGKKDKPKKAKKQVKVRRIPLPYGNIMHFINS